MNASSRPRTSARRCSPGPAVTTRTREPGPTSTCPTSPADSRAEEEASVSSQPSAGTGASRSTGANASVGVPRTGATVQGPAGAAAEDPEESPARVRGRHCQVPATISATVAASARGTT